MASEKADTGITHLSEAFTVMGKPISIKTDNGSVYISKQFQAFFKLHNIHHVTGIPGNSTGQSIIEQQHRSLKEMLYKQKGGEGHGMTPWKRITSALFMLNFLNLHAENLSPALKHWVKISSQDLHQPVFYKDVHSSQWLKAEVL